MLLSKMTNSDLGGAAGARARPLGKRERLIAAACQRVYEQGVEKTTLADIAQAAGVPLGNVYYYFKTKDDIVRAVVETHLDEATAMLALLPPTLQQQPASVLHALGAIGRTGSDP